MLSYFLRKGTQILLLAETHPSDKPCMVFCHVRHVAISAVIHEGDAAVYGGAKDAEVQRLIHPVQPNMRAPDPDRRDFLSRAAERSVEHPFLYSVVLPSKCSLSASASARVWWTTPSR